MSKNLNEMKKAPPTSPFPIKAALRTEDFFTYNILIIKKSCHSYDLTVVIMVLLNEWQLEDLYKLWGAYLLGTLKSNYPESPPPNLKVCSVWIMISLSCRSTYFTIMKTWTIPRRN